MWRKPWHVILDHYFWRPRRAPDIIVVLYFGDNLADGKDIDIGRLGWCFTDREDWPEVLGTDLPTFSERADFLLSSLSITWAMKGRIKKRLLALATPGYRQYEDQVNAVNFARQGGAGASGSASHAVLKRLLDQARSCNSQVCFVAFPTLAPDQAEPYDLSAEEARMIADAGMSLIDLRRVPGLTPEMYATRTHLNAAGRPLFSRCLARALSAVVRAGPERDGNALGSDRFPKCEQDDAYGR